MTTKRRIREDFNTAEEYVVCVEGCSDEEKKEVQQAFFDVGINWFGSDAIYQFTDVLQYSNVTSSGKRILLGWRTRYSNICMTPKEFLELVYVQDESKNKKLIDILIDNDIKWPEGASGVVQDSDGDVKFYTGEKPFIDDSGVWIRPMPHITAYLNETASDYRTAIITKTDWDNRKMNKKAMFADAKVGDKVWDIRQGWGVVNSLTQCYDHPIYVDFGHVRATYTMDGYYHLDDVNPSLFWDEIEIKAPPKPLPDLAVDTKVFVWDNLGTKLCRHFSHFDEDGVLHTFDGGRTSFTGSGDTHSWSNWELVE